MDNGEGMIKKVRFSLDLRDVIEKSNRSGKIIEPMDAISDELLDKLVDDMIANHIKDFISAYIKKELGFGNLEFEGDLLL
jgi:hypothetical protein